MQSNSHADFALKLVDAIWSCNGGIAFRLRSHEMSAAIKLDSLLTIFKLQHCIAAKVTKHLLKYDKSFTNLGTSNKACLILDCTLCLLDCWNNFHSFLHHMRITSLKQNAFSSCVLKLNKKLE